MTRHPDLGPAAREARGPPARVDDRQLDAPTPCPDCTVAQPIGHIAGFCGGFRDAARKDFGPTANGDPGACVPEPPADWRDLLPVLPGELSHAWCGLQAWAGETAAGGITLPAAAAGRFALNELPVHGWDPVRATGQDHDPAEPGLRAAITLPSGVRGACGDAADGPGPFGRPVPVPAAAPLDRLLGLTGRDPAWSPPR